MLSGWYPQRTSTLSKGEGQAGQRSGQKSLLDPSAEVYQGFTDKTISILAGSTMILALAFGDLTPENLPWLGIRIQLGAKGINSNPAPQWKLNQILCECSQGVVCASCWTR